MYYYFMRYNLLSSNDTCLEEFGGKYVYLNVTKYGITSWNVWHFIQIYKYILLEWNLIWPQSRGEDWKETERDRDCADF